MILSPARGTDKTRLISLPEIHSDGTLVYPLNPMINLAQARGTLFCPRCGERQFAAADGKSLRCAACQFQYFHNNAAAVGAIIRVGPEVLFTVRSREPRTGLLDLPGGFVDPGESLETALRREVREELGLEIRELKYLFSFPNSGYLYGGVSYTTADAFYEINLGAKPNLALQEEEVGAVRWLRPARVRDGDIAFNSIRAAIAALRK